MAHGGFFHSKFDGGRGRSSRAEKAIDVARWNEYLPFRGLQALPVNIWQIRMHVHARVQSAAKEKSEIYIYIKIEREREGGGRKGKAKERKVQEQLAHPCQRDKTNHRNNRRPPQPASRHGHVASRATRTHA